MVCGVIHVAVDLTNIETVCYYIHRSDVRWGLFNKDYSPSYCPQVLHPLYMEMYVISRLSPSRSPLTKHSSIQVGVVISISDNGDDCAPGKTFTVHKFVGSEAISSDDYVVGLAW